MKSCAGNYRGHWQVDGNVTVPTFRATSGAMTLDLDEENGHEDNKKIKDAELRDVSGDIWLR